MQDIGTIWYCMINFIESKGVDLKDQTDAGHSHIGTERQSLSAASRWHAAISLQPFLSMCVPIQKLLHKTFSVEKMAVHSSHLLNEIPRCTRSGSEAQY